MRKVIIVLIISVVSGAFSVAQDLSNTDYKKALWMTTRFYGGQRSGDNNWLIYDHLPSGVNSNLRGKAFRADRDGSVDLSGGWHDCGDHVKFGQTQFYSAYMLLKGYEQFKAGYGDYYSADYAGYTSQSTSGSAPGWQWEGSAHDPNGIPDILDEIKHETDFLIKCTPNGSTFYYQIGDGGGNGDHATNNTAVKIQTFAVNQGGNNDNGAGSPSGPFRGAYKNPNDGAMASMCAAALALMSKQYEPFDPAYAALCLTHAENAYTYASNHIGQAAGTANGGFYSAHDNAYNPWAICLGEMFKATGQNSYKTTMNALSVGLTGSPQVKPNIFYSFDYANVGELALFVMAELGNSTARTAFNDHYSNHWINGSNYGGEGNYTGGGGWGQLRYTGNASFIVALYKKLNGLTTLNSKVFDNVDYILGSNNAKQSFVVGYAPTAVGGVTYAQHPHHRNAYLRDDNPSGGAMSATNIPNKNIQLGALVGGNKTNSASYDDTWTEFVNTEVCIDYNAGLVGGLAAINAQLDPVDTNIYLSQCASPGDLGGNQTLCGSGSIVLNSGLGTKSGRTFQWFRNEISQGSPSSSATTRTVTQAGTWKVVVDSSGACQRSSSVIITGTLPTVDLGADVELCDPSSTTFDAGVSGTGVNYAWTKDGNAYSNTQQINVSDAGTYAVTVSASGCPSQNDQVIVTSLLPEVNNDTICAAGAAASLQVTSPGGPFEWYANATGGSALQTGTTYTPTVSSNTTYYVVDAGSFSGNVGETTYLSGTQNWGVASGNHLNFDVLQDFSIEALKVSYGNVYSDQTGTITIEILDGSGNSFTPAKTFTSDGTAITTGMANSLIRFTFTGFDIKKSWGTSLRMRVSGHSNIGDLIWTQNGASYPYNSNPVGVVNITGTTGGNNDSNDYMYFYDWEVSSGVSCARRPVDVILAPGSPACSNACTPPASSAITPSSTQDICMGSNVLLTANSVSGYLYRWYRDGTPIAAAAINDNTLSVSQAGDYTVRIGDGDINDGACYLESSPVTVNVNSLPTATITTSALNYCEGVNGLTLDAANGGSGATYSWSGPVTGSGQSLSNATAGVYTVTVTRNGCDETSTSVTVVEDVSPTASISTSGTDLEYCAADGGVTLSATNAGAGATYSWSGPVTGSGINLSSATAGVYTVSVTRNGCNATSGSVTVVENTSPIASISTSGAGLIYCELSGGVTLSATDAGVGATYSWSGPVSGSGIDLSNATAGVYSVTVTKDGCNATSSNTTVVETPLPAAVITTTGLSYCAGNPGLTLDAQTVSGGAYSWSGPVTGSGASLPNATSGNYTVTVTANGCNATSSSVTVSEGAAPTASILTSGTDLEYCAADGDVTLSAADAGVGATYSWSGPVSGSGINLSNATAGVYTVTVSMNGCDAISGNVTVVENTSPIASILTSGAGLIYCELSGGVTLSATDAGVGATYSWSGPVSGSGIDLSNATAGVYSVTVTKDGCNATSSNTTVVETPLPAAVITTTGLSYCAGNPGLTLDAQTVSGGAYSWSGPVTGSGASLPNATSGNYTVTVTANGCNATSSSVTVSEGAAPTASILTSGTDLEYCAADGDVTLSAADAGVGATYSWSGPVSGSGINLSNATAGVYTVTVSMNGCDAISGSVTVVENISPIASISTSGVDLEYCTTDGGVTLSATDAGVGATYSWSGPVTGSGISLSNATAGMYDVSVTLNGCNTMSTSVTVLENPLPIASITTTNLEYCTGVNGVTLDAQTVSGATYSWSGPVTGSGISLSNATAGVYDVLVTVNGCATTSSTVTVLENVLPVASITTTDLDYCQGTLGVTLDAQVIPGATYSWSGPVTGGGASLSNVTAGSYTVTVSENGCDAISPTVVVTETLLPTAQIMTSGAQLVYCSTGQNGVTLTAADAGIGATYTWSGPVTGSGISLSNATSGTYSVDVSLNGCMSTSSTADVVENCTVSCSAPTSVVIDQGASINVCDGDNVVLSATTVLNTATNQYYYTWMSGGIPLTTPSTTYQDLSLSPVTVANAGTIQLRVEDADGVTFDDPLCYVDGVINLTVNTIPTATITSTDFDYCTGDGGVTLDAQVVSGATYTWTGPVTGTGSSLSNATAGDYSVTVTANGCVSTSLLTTVTETTIPTAVITTTALEYCQGVSGVTLDAQVVSGATYSWSGPVTGTTQSLSNATSGTYTVTVDLNGCIATSILATVVENVSPIAQITTSGSQLEYCSTGQNGVTLDAIDAGIGATYSWSGPITGTGISLANATSGLYTVDVTLNGCTSTSSASAVLEVCAATCTAPTSVTIDQAGPVSLCEGETLTISGSAVTGTPVNQYYYTWYHDGNAVSTPSTTYQDFTLTSVSLPEAGSYVLRVEDADGVTFNNAACYQEAVLDITVNPLPVANITTTALDYCVGGAGVSLDAQTVIGATYLWSGPVTGSNQTLLNALAGSYTVTITDLNNCSDISSPVTVVENSLPTAQIATSGSQLVYCSTGQNGVTLDAIDAGIGATYSWSGPVTSSSISLANATSGSYTVDVTLNGCITTSASVMVTESCGTTCNPPASVIIDQLSPVTLCESNNLTLTGSAVTGAPLNQYYYTWYHDGVAVSTPSTSLQSLDLASVVLTDNGTYVLRVEDSDGIIFNNVACYQEANVDVIVNANPSASISTTTLDYCEGGTGVTLDAQVVAGATYIWSGPVSGSGQSLLNATEGAYTVTVDLNGCSSTSTSSNITTLPLPSHTGQITGAITACDNGVENYSIPTITNALSVDWTCVSGCGQVSLTPSGNDVSVSFGTESFVIEVSGNNACGASSSEQIAVNVQQTLPPSITIIPDNLQVCEGGTVTFTSSVSEAGNTPTYEWFRNGSSTGAATSSLIATGISNGDSFEATITSSDVCGAGLTSTSASVVITTGTVTGITTIDGPDQLCVKTDPIANFSVTNNTGSTYNWMVPDSVIILSGQGTSQVELDFNIENGGFIQVLEVSAGGCVGNTVGLNVINNCIDGFEDELFESHASLYPNPSSNDFHIEVMDGEEAVLRILDLNGIVLKEELVNTRELISFGEELEEGVYILQIIQEDQMLVRKITKLD